LEKYLDIANEMEYFPLDKKDFVRKESSDEDNEKDLKIFDETIEKY
jgi:hypothetical protein